MARLKAANLCQTTLAQDCPSNATIIYVSSPSGFPQPPFRIFVGTNQDYEIMEVTNVDNNAWTVLRAQEGTTAKAWPAGTRVENRFTAGYYSELVSQDELTWDNISDKPSAFPPSSHAQSHQPSGNDPLAARDILALDCEYTSRTIYVDSQYGSDTSGDGSQSSPFQTVAKALSTIKQVIADRVTITIHLVGRGPGYPYTIPTFGRLCIGSGAVRIEGELSVQDSGTATGGDPVTITDSTKNWTPDQWAGKLVKLTRSGVDYWRLIYSNTATSLTVIGRLEITPQSGDSYAIYDWNTFLANATVKVTQGTVNFYDLANTALSGTLAFRFDDPVKITLDRIWVKAVGGSSTALLATGSPTIVCSCCFFDGNGQTHRALGTQAAQGLNLNMYRCWSKGWAGSPNIWIGGPGTYAFIHEGTILDGSDCVVWVSREALAMLYCSTINGAVDKITIKNGATYGLRVSAGAGAIFTGTSHVTYSGNGTDRSADSTAWYLDTE